MTNENRKTTRVGERLDNGPSQFIFADGVPDTTYKYEDFSNRYLRQVNFAGHNLHATSFVGSAMPGVVLAGTVLSEASFVGANMWAADLRGAECLHADFRAAMLQGVLFDIRTEFVGCDFRGATMSKDLFVYLLQAAEEWQLRLEGVSLSEWSREDMCLSDDFFTVQDS